MLPCGAAFVRLPLRELLALHLLPIVFSEIVYAIKIKTFFCF